MTITKQATYTHIRQQLAHYDIETVIKLDILRWFKNDNLIEGTAATRAYYISRQCRDGKMPAGVSLEAENLINDVKSKWSMTAEDFDKYQYAATQLVHSCKAPIPVVGEPMTTTAEPVQEQITPKEIRAINLGLPAPVVNDDAMQAIQALLAAVSKPSAPVIDEAMIEKLVHKYAQATEVKITTKDTSKIVVTGLQHKVLPEIIKMVSSGVNVMMVGPAGSGKTTIADQTAKALGLSFYFNGALSSEYKLSGFIDAQGRIVSTAFRKAYEEGGLYLFDEIDASMPDALLAFNAALANGHADFPDGAINRHKDFACLAAANTFGRGADRVYVGRNQLDGASLDRFAVINIDYDEKLERALTGNDTWVDYVQAIRRAIEELKIRHIVSPRASINGARLLAAGLDKDFVKQSVIWKGLDKDSVYKVTSKAGV